MGAVGGLDATGGADRTRRLRFSSPTHGILLQHIRSVLWSFHSQKEGCHVSWIAFYLPQISVPASQFVLAALAGVSAAMYLITRGRIEYLMVFVTLAFFLFAMQ
jgi:hypothetical protein